MKTKILLFILLFTQIVNSQEKKMRSIEDFANPALQTASTHLRSSTDNDEFSQKALHEESNPNLVFNIEDGVLIGYSGSGGEVIIPDEVTAIGERVFYGNTTITSVTIPEGVTSIGNWAFRYCYNLASVVIPSTVTSIGDYAFAYCNSLQSITVSWATPLVISATVFEGVNKRNCTLNVPESSLEAYQTASVWKAFLDDSDFEIDENGVLIDYYGAEGEVTIPDEVTAIGNEVFYNNTTITSVTIPESVTSIGYSAFRYCGNLTSITIPNSVTSIGNYAFAYCNRLQSITVSWATPLVISATVFEGVNQRNCTLNVPESSLGAYQTASVWKAFLDDSDFEIDENGVLIDYYGIGGEVIIPDGVTSIGDDVFYNCNTLTSIIIPEGVTSIGNYAFYNCLNLTSITLSGRLTSIGNYAFANCNTLTSIIIPEGVTSIGNYAFANCGNLTSITIPNSVTSIGNYAFNYCSKLQSITVLWATPLDIPATVFNGVNKRTCTLNVPEASLEAYQTAPDWKAFLDDSDFEIDENGVLAGYYGDGGEVIIPEGVTAIRNKVFNGNTTITSVTIPEGVTSIGSYAFGVCRNLRKVTVQWDVPLAQKSPEGVSNDAFAYIANDCVLFVPVGTKELYDVADVWKNFASIVELFLTVSTLSLEFEKEAGEETVTIESNIEWSVVKTAGADWITLTEGEGTLLVAVSANETHEPRTAEITVSGEGVEDQVITVSQKSRSFVNINAPQNENITLSVKDGILRISSSVSEQITIYSVNGVRLFRNEKPQGKVVFNIGRLQDKVLVIKGTSGWVRKILN